MSRHSDWRDQILLHRLALGVAICLLAGFLIAAHGQFERARRYTNEFHAVLEQRRRLTAEREQLEELETEYETRLRDWDEETKSLGGVAQPPNPAEKLAEVRAAIGRADGRLQEFPELISEHERRGFVLLWATALPVAVIVFSMAMSAVRSRKWSLTAEVFGREVKPRPHGGAQTAQPSGA